MTVNIEKMMDSLPSGIYEWDANSGTMSTIELGAQIVSRKSVFCIETNGTHLADDEQPR